MILDPYDYNTLQIFFDDNIREYFILPDKGIT